MDKLVFSCFLLGGLTPDPNPTDPCTVLNGYCAAGVTNVGCNPPALSGGPACAGKNPEVVELLVADKTYILDKLNFARNAYASGVYGNAKANRMFKLQWDANLAIQAGHNARSCVIARDACRNTADYANVGQVIKVGSGPSSLLATLTIQNQIDGLLVYGIFLEAYIMGLARLSSYSASTNTENAANILNDRSTKMGCALMHWTDGAVTNHYIVCNFSANVIEGQPVYTPAATAGAGCATTDQVYTALCLT